MSRFLDLTGLNFNRWLVLRHAGFARDRASIWECKCQCGEIRTVRGKDLRRKDGRESTSCGCYRRENSRAKGITHGMCRTPEYTAWYNIRARCNDPKNHRYKSYGGRGIRMSSEWEESFEQFFSDMGSRPSMDHSVERRDNNAGYSKENCCWATSAEQRRNTSRNVKLTYKGETLILKDWSKKLGIHYETLRARIARGWPMDRVLA